MKTLLILFIATFISLCGASQNPNPNAALSNYIVNEMSNENIPGAATLIVKNGSIVWLESFGMADISANTAVADNTIFLLASISKLFTGTALMTLADDGIINLDDPINNFLPFSIEIPGHTSTDITYRMLMTHTASIEDNGSVMNGYYSIGDPTISLPTVIQQYFDPNGSDYSAAGNFHNKQPGTFYDYSNMGTALVGYMVEVVSGMPFDQYCDLHIFDTLCMDDSSWYLAGLDTNRVAVPYSWQGGQFVGHDHYGFADYPNGQLRMSILNLANYMLAFLQNGTTCSSGILSSSEINKMLSLQVPSVEPSQGLNWYKEDIYLNGGGTVSLWGHNGGETGVSTDLYINPNNGIGIAVLTNGEGDNLNMIDELYNYALTITALPIELTTFTAQEQDKKVHLGWQTASETSNRGFQIEHSADGNNWRNIGFVEGKGNSAALNDYQFTDHFPISGLNYYRLKQMDYDGAFEYSTIKSVELLVPNSQWSVAPNPVKDGVFSLFVSNLNFVSGKILLFDSIGRLVHSQTIIDTHTDIQISTLPKGVYVVTLEINGQRSSERLVVQ